ncbi:MAG: bacteriohemerythrin [Lachnospiraceae bacterium]|nr:bacteriohemerythrin [Lachnospiraceae bacterium]
MYEFTEDCMIHIDQIDEEHRRLFQMLNEAFAMVQETEDVSAITISLLSNLKNYALTHFAHEEAYMESIHDPELPLQKTEHAMFAKKVNSFVPDTSSPEAARKSLNDLLTYLVRWLYRHILCSDMMIGKSLSSAENDPFAFTSKYMTGITLIDDEHRRLFEIIKETNDLIHEEFLHDKYDEIVRLITELRDYTEFHFSDEEALMTRIQYPGLDAQKRAHSAFIERLVEIDLNDLDEMDDHQQEYLLDLIQFLLDWLTNHILACDRKIGEYMCEHHISE